MSNNPFEELRQELREQKKLLEKLLTNQQMLGESPQVSEIIDRDTLCARLGISLPTAIRYTQKKTIPVIRIGTTVRYDWQAVLKALQKNKS